MSRFEDKAVVVTGAARGIGRAIVERFVDEGAGVVALDCSEDVAELAAERCTPIVGDQSRQGDCRKAVELCIDRFGTIDVMCAHAGIAEPMPFLDLTDEHWRRHMSVNVDGIFYLIQEAARAMVADGRRGAIVCTTSINAWHVEETHAVYNVTKGAIWTLIRSAAIDLGPQGIRVNGIAPGVVDTPIAEMVVHDPELAPRYLTTIPLGRFGRTSDIADAVLFVASDEASYMTGQTLVIDGGQTLGIRGELNAAATVMEGG